MRSVCVWILGGLCVGLSRFSGRNELWLCADRALDSLVGLV